MKTSQFETSITADALQRLMQRGPVQLLDVRTPGEFAEAHVPGAMLVPLDDFNPVLFLREVEPDCGPIYVICHSGTRARNAIQKFHRAGFDRCVLVQGGTQAWIDSGLPVVRGARKKLPLNIQMIIRRFAGSFILASLLLAQYHSQYWLWFTAFVGFNLLQSSFTNFCPLEMLLKKLGLGAGPCCAEKTAGSHS